MKQAAAILLVSLLCPSLALGQERNVVLDAPMEATLGDAIDVLVTVTAAAGDDAAVPEQSFEPFEIISKKASVAASPDDTAQTFTFELQLLCFELGVHELGPIRVRITSAAGELVDIASNTASIEVRSVLANEPDPELKPASQPVIVEQDDYRLLIVLGALLALAIGALFAWLLMRWWQKRERMEPAPPPPPPPWDTALAQLHALERERPAAISEGRTEPWVDAVSDSVRVYLGRRFGFQGIESTTDEIAVALARTKSLRIAPEEAIGFLNQCDLVKFAKASLAEDASRSLIEDALAMVDRTRPANVESLRGES